jgi:NAD(P)-dependent dehydrogenase (short-subunit alcohol dehydrogenase family)
MSKKVVLITGASRGIGLSTAQYLLEQGYIVYGTSRSKDHLESNKNGILFLLMDLSQDLSVTNGIKEILDNEGQIDIVVNSAAMGLFGPAEECSLDQARSLFEVNVFGAMRLMKNILPQFRKQGHGLMIHVSSMAALDSFPGLDWYTASKCALEGLVESMAYSVSTLHNINLVLVEPGPVNTDFMIKTSELGKAELPERPYGGMGKNFFDWNTEVLRSGQDPKEIAELIHRIIEDPRPSLRYQTSAAMKEVARKKLVDPTGDSYLHEKQEFTKFFLERSNG